MAPTFLCQQVRPAHDTRRGADGNQIIPNLSLPYISKTKNQLQLKKLGKVNCYLDFFHRNGVFIRRGRIPNSAAVRTTEEGYSPSRNDVLGKIDY